MKVTITCKHLEHSLALDKIIQTKSEKLQKFFQGNFQIDWTCYIDDGVHYADIQVAGPSFHYHASAHSENMYKTCDEAVQKLERQISKKKFKWKDKIHRDSRKHLVYIPSPEVSWNDYDEDQFDDVG